MKQKQLFHIDSKQYLRELIADYNQKLEDKYWSLLYQFIQEEKFKCMQHLRRLKAIEVEGIFMAKINASPFPITN